MQTLLTQQKLYKTIAPIDQSDLEFLLPADNETYVDPNLKLYIKGKFEYLACSNRYES
jgi:hypothetical protein